MNHNLPGGMGARRGGGGQEGALAPLEIKKYGPPKDNLTRKNEKKSRGPI